MTLNEYQTAAWSTALPSAKNLEYLQLGLLSELGEVAGVLKRKIRDGVSDTWIEDLKKEIGDCLWYCLGIYSFLNTKAGHTPLLMVQPFDGRGPVMHSVILTTLRSFNSLSVPFPVLRGLATICRAHGITLKQCAELNIAKLKDRQQRNVLTGKGGER